MSEERMKVALGGEAVGELELDLTVSRRVRGELRLEDLGGVVVRHRGEGRGVTLGALAAPAGLGVGRGALSGVRASARLPGDDGLEVAVMAASLGGGGPAADLQLAELTRRGQGGDTMTLGMARAVPHQGAEARSLLYLRGQAPLGDLGGLRGEARVTPGQAPHHLQLVLTSPREAAVRWSMGLERSRPGAGLLSPGRPPVREVLRGQVRKQLRPGREVEGGWVLARSGAGPRSLDSTLGLVQRLAGMVARVDLLARRTLAAGAAELDRCALTLRRPIPFAGGLELVPSLALKGEERRPAGGESSTLVSRRLGLGLRSPTRGKLDLAFARTERAGGVGGRDRSDVSLAYHLPLPGRGELSFRVERQRGGASGVEERTRGQVRFSVRF